MATYVMCKRGETEPLSAYAWRNGRRVLLLKVSWHNYQVPVVASHFRRSIISVCLSLIAIRGESFIREAVSSARP